MMIIRVETGTPSPYGSDFDSDKIMRLRLHNHVNKLSEDHLASNLKHEKVFFAKVMRKDNLDMSGRIDPLAFTV
jgi:hypothetical protein